MMKWEEQWEESAFIPEGMPIQAEKLMPSEKPLLLFTVIASQWTRELYQALSIGLLKCIIPQD